MLAPALLAALAALARLPTLAAPLTPDEGGFLVVASQWSPGSSLYGAYFVDRPPLLIGIFGLADALGGAFALRLLGIVAVVAAVLLAGRIGRTPAAAVAATFLSTPLFGAMEIDGELLAVPLLLGSFWLILRSVRGDTGRARYADPLLAGVLATAAVLVKQNLADGFLVAAVLLAALALRGGGREAADRALAFAGGAAGAVTLALLAAYRRGTSPVELWDALVTFRADAAEVINASASSATATRFSALALALVLSALPLVVGGLLLGRSRPLAEPALLVAALSVLGWESAGVLLGGSYWSHYLVALVPGLVLLAAACGDSRLARLTTVLAAVSTGFALSWALTHPLSFSSDRAVAAYIRHHARPRDTVVVAFGHADIVRETGLSSPYPYLWSLPARVRDPRLDQLTTVLDGAHPPRWVVVDGDSLATWGIDATSAQPVLDTHYRRVDAAGDWQVLERVRVDR